MGGLSCKGLKSVCLAAGSDFLDVGAFLNAPLQQFLKQSLVPAAMMTYLRQKVKQLKQVYSLCKPIFILYCPKKLKTTVLWNMFSREASRLRFFKAILLIVSVCLGQTVFYSNHVASIFLFVLI